MGLLFSPSFLLFRGLGTGLFLAPSFSGTPLVGMALCVGEVVGVVCGEGLLKTSGMETRLPDAGGITDGSMMLCSLTELVRESNRSCTDERLCECVECSG